MNLLSCFNNNKKIIQPSIAVIKQTSQSSVQKQNIINQFYKFVIQPFILYFALCVLYFPQLIHSEATQNEEVRIGCTQAVYPTNKIYMLCYGKHEFIKTRFFCTKSSCFHFAKRSHTFTVLAHLPSSGRPGIQNFDILFYTGGRNRRSYSCFTTKSFFSTESEKLVFFRDKCVSINLVDKFIRLLTIDGKKSKAHTVFFIALRLCRDKLVAGRYIKNISEPLTKILYQAVENVKPSLEIRKVRIAASTYQVPAITSQKRQETLAIRWIIMCAHKRKKNNKNNFSDCLAQELADSFLKQGQSRQKRDQLYNIAESNRAFVRYRWW